MAACAYIVSAALTGFVGDALLQIGTKHFGFGGPTGYGLREYFRVHGVVESLFIAAGMMTIFFIAYAALGLPFKLAYLALYGIALDAFFRATMICPSLRGYYEHLNYFWSAFWGAVPAMMPVAIVRALWLK